MDHSIPKIIDLRNQAISALVMEQFPEEIAVSLPVPKRRGDQLVAVLFGAFLQEFEGNSQIYQPAVTVEIDWENGGVVDKQTRSNPFPSLGEFPVGRLIPVRFADMPPSQPLDDFDIDDLEALADEFGLDPFDGFETPPSGINASAEESIDLLYDPYGEALAAFSPILEAAAHLYPRAPQDTVQQQTIANCRARYDDLIDPSTRHLVEALNPDFFYWLATYGASMAAPGAAAVQYCGQCGAVNKRSSKFCTTCGKPLG